jgi:hypothetical protein
LLVAERYRYDVFNNFITSSSSSKDDDDMLNDRTSSAGVDFFPTFFTFAQGPIQLVGWEALRFCLKYNSLSI